MSSVILCKKMHLVVCIWDSGLSGMSSWWFSQGSTPHRDPLCWARSCVVAKLPASQIPRASSPWDTARLRVSNTWEAEEAHSKSLRSSDHLHVPRALTMTNLTTLLQHHLPNLWAWVCQVSNRSDPDLPLIPASGHVSDFFSHISSIFGFLAFQSTDCEWFPVTHPIILLEHFSKGGWSNSKYKGEKGL